MSKRFTESLKKMITAVNQVIFKTSRVLGPSDPRPIDESDCYNEEGSFNLNQYEEYIEREEEETVFKRNVCFLMLLVQLFEYCRRRRKAKAVRRRMLIKPPVKRARIRHPKFFTDPTTGILRSVTPRVSLWWILYIQDPKPENAQWSKTFRRRFRLPYESFLTLLQMLFPMERVWSLKQKSESHSAFVIGLFVLSW
jgi:hypothetical protein